MKTVIISPDCPIDVSVESNLPHGRFSVVVKGEELEAGSIIFVAMLPPWEIDSIRIEENDMPEDPEEFARFVFDDEQVRDSPHVSRILARLPSMYAVVKKTGEVIRFDTEVPAGNYSIPDDHLLVVLVG